jgi:uncharacterized protein (DUF1501 family)
MSMTPLQPGATRRHFLIGAAATSAVTLLPGMALAQSATDRRFIFIMQRGAADGLAMLAPVGDPAFAGLRRDLIEESGAQIDSHFRLHPAFAQVAQLHAAGQARFFPAVASNYRERSHFDGQNVLEGGGNRPFGRQDGWMGRLLSMLPAPERSAIALAEAVPLALRGFDGVTSYTPSRIPHASDDLVQRVSALYAQDPQLHGLWENALRTRAIAGDIGAEGGGAETRAQAADQRVETT